MERPLPLAIECGFARAREARAWQTLQNARSNVDRAFDELAARIEDDEDLAEARAALREPGDSISWEQVKQELRLE